MTQDSNKAIGARSNANELNDLKVQLQAIEKKYSATMKKYEANSDYRNELIWMSEDINKINLRIRQLEKQGNNKRTIK